MPKNKKKLNIRSPGKHITGVYMLLVVGPTLVQGCPVPTVHCLMDMLILGSKDVRYASVVELVCN